MAENKYVPRWNITPPPESITVQRHLGIFSPVNSMYVHHEQPWLAAAVSLRRPVFAELGELESDHFSAVHLDFLWRRRRVPLRDALLQSVAIPLCTFPTRRSHDVFLPGRRATVIAEEISAVLREVPPTKQFVARGELLGTKFSVV